MRSSKNGKESSAAPVPSRPGLSKAYYEDQLAKIEKFIADNENDSKRLKGYHELKVCCEQKIAEYSTEVVTV